MPRSVKFFMPAPVRHAETPGNVQISDTTGSGPFVFRKDSVAAGRSARSTTSSWDYKPRPEPASA